MVDDYETQIDLGDEAADSFGQVCDPGARVRAGSPAPGWFAGHGDLRRNLAASLLQAWVTGIAHEGVGPIQKNSQPSPGKWPGAAKKALAAASVIYPDPKEAE